MISIQVSTVKFLKLCWMFENVYSKMVEKQSYLI